MNGCYRCGYPSGPGCPSCRGRSPYGPSDESYHREQISMLREIMYRLDKMEADRRSFTQMPPYYYESDSKLKKKKDMKIGVMMKKFLDSDIQTLVKAGYINGDLELTTEGTTALDSVVFDANKAALVTLAQEKLDEEKKK